MKFLRSCYLFLSLGKLPKLMDQVGDSRALKSGRFVFLNVGVWWVNFKMNKCMYHQLSGCSEVEAR